MGFISLGKIDKKCIPILIGCIIAFLSRLLFRVKETKLFEQKSLPNLIATIAKLFSFIPYIIFKRQSKKVHNNDIQNRNSNGVELIYFDRTIEQTGDKWKYILLSAILIFVQGIILLYTYNIKSNTWIWDILITSFLYYFIFKVKLFKHHYLSMGIIILTGLIIDLASENLQEDIINNLLFLFLRVLREILFSLNDVISKYVMEKKFCSIYELMFYTGFLDFFFFGSYTLLSYYYFKVDNFEEYFNNFNIIELLVVIGVMITQFGLFLFTLIINKNNTPCHLFIMYVFAQFAYYLDFSIKSIIFIFCYIFILFWSLIFNEIIELNFWGLSDNTKKNIMLRVEIEENAVNTNSTMNTMKTFSDIDDIGRTTIELGNREN